MPFEVGKYHKGVLVGRMAAHGHFFEPFATVNGQCQSIFLVHNIYGAECPAVHFQRPPVFVSTILALGRSLSGRAFTYSRGIMFGPFCSPVCSFTPICPLISALTCSYALISPSTLRLRVK